MTTKAKTKPAVADVKKTAPVKVAVKKVPEKKPAVKVAAKPAVKKAPAKPVQAPKAAPVAKPKDLSPEVKKQARAITDQALKAFDAAHSMPSMSVNAVVPAPKIPEVQPGTRSIVELMNKIRR